MGSGTCAPIAISVLLLIKRVHNQHAKEVVVSGGGHLQCQWHVRGHRLKRSESSYISACSFMRTDTSITQFSITWLEAMLAMRPKGPSSQATLCKFCPAPSAVATGDSAALRCLCL